MKIYNTSSLDHNSRFLLAIVASLASTVGLAIAYGILLSTLHVEFSIIYIFFGWCIGEVIKSVGHGVTLKFAILGGIMTALGIILADTFTSYGLSTGFMMLVHPNYWGMMIQAWLVSHVSTNINTLLGLLFRVGGIYYGYWNSRIL